MLIDRESLAKTYHDKEDAELLAFYSSDTLTELAREVLEQELAKRGITIPNNLENAVVTSKLSSKPRPQSLRAHWRGQASLASAYWLIGVVGSAILGVMVHGLEAVIDAPESASLHTNIQIALGLSYTSLSILSILYAIFATVSIWRCSWNSDWKGWGYIARFVVVVNAIYLLIYHIVMI